MGTRSSRGQRDEGSKENSCPNGGGGEGPEKDSCPQWGEVGPSGLICGVGRVLEKDLFHSMDELRREGGGGLRGGLREGEKKKFGEGERDAKREDFFFHVHVKKMRASCLV